MEFESQQRKSIKGKSKMPDPCGASLADIKGASSGDSTPQVELAAGNVHIHETKPIIN